MNIGIIFLKINPKNLCHLAFSPVYDVCLTSSVMENMYQENHIKGYLLFTFNVQSHLISGSKKSSFQGDTQYLL